MQQISEENLNKIRKSALKAGQYILSESQNFSARLNVRTKNDGTPVTQIDQVAEDIVVETLDSLYPNVPIIAEERFSNGEAQPLKSADTFWLVDALDGTKDFIAGTGEYTVNIALIENGVPIYGLIYAPEKNLFCEALQGQGAFLYDIKEEIFLKNNQISVRPLNHDLTLITSGRQKTSSKLTDLFDGYRVNRRKTSGSSLKFVMIASGEADIYPRLGYTSEWDIAAGDAILREAGGVIIDLSTGKSFTYGHEDRKFLNSEFIALPKTLYDAKPEYFFRPFK